MKWYSILILGLMAIGLGVGIYYAYKTKKAAPAPGLTDQPQTTSDPYGGVDNDGTEPGYPISKYAKTFYKRINDGGVLTLPKDCAISECWYGLDGVGHTWHDPRGRLEPLISKTSDSTVTVSPTTMGSYPNPGEASILKLRVFYNV